MRMGKSTCYRRNERRTSRLIRWLTIPVVFLGLVACNPVEAWRDFTGASRNDPDPDTTPNTKNLAAGEASDFPNLATVPPPPIRALTAAEREKLTQSLIADRTNARYTDEQVRVGSPASSSAPPPPPPLPSAGEPDGGQVAPPARSAAASPSALLPHEVEPTPPASTPPSPPAATPSVAPTSGSAAGQQAGAGPGVRALAAKGAVGKTPAGPGQGLRNQGEPPEPGPMESSLEIPQARATPQPEQVEPPPPPPQLPPTPKVASTPSSLPAGLAPGGVLAPTPSPAASDSAGFQPPPPPPELPPLPPSRSAAVSPERGGPKPSSPAAKPVAEVKFTVDSTSLTDKDRESLETVLPLYKENPRKVRIVGYADAGSGAVEQLNGYRTALDRAQAVAAALTKAGIPSDKIQVEAAPAGTNSSGNRAEVLLEQ
jgi:outer membrane protein OmpA-like peptidoglycan-associated protein